MKPFLSILLLIGATITFNTLLAQTTPNTTLTTETFLDFEDCGSIITIYPSAFDFEAGKEGVILISTSLDDNYHTTYQEQDGVVKIRAVLPETYAGQTVYFRTVDPDLDDQSSYEEDTAGGDNRDMRLIGGETVRFLGALSQTQVTTIIDGGYAIAETELTITNRYAGDNYQVEASLDENFSTVVKTIEFIAWKRVYVEVDKMYRKGATILGAGYTSDSNNSPDMISVDNIEDFSVGDEIEFFAYPRLAQSPVLTTVEAIIGGTIRVTDPGNEYGSYSFPAGCGVKLKDDNSTFEIITSVYEVGETGMANLIESAFGKDPKGNDGGVFVEFIWGIEGSGIMAKLTEFPSPDIAGDIATLWRRLDCDPYEEGGSDCENYIQLVIAYGYFNNSYGITDEGIDVTFMFERSFINSEPPLEINMAYPETLVHEFGHEFGLQEWTSPVVHDNLSPTDYPNHEASDQGVMTWDRVRDEGEAEFFIDCVYWIRDFVDGI